MSRAGQVLTSQVVVNSIQWTRRASGKEAAVPCLSETDASSPALQPDGTGGSACAFA